MVPDRRPPAGLAAALEALTAHVDGLARAAGIPLPAHLPLTLPLLGPLPERAAAVERALVAALEASRPAQAEAGRPLSSRISRRNAISPIPTRPTVTVTCTVQTGIRAASLFIPKVNSRET